MLPHVFKRGKKRKKKKNTQTCICIEYYTSSNLTIKPWHSIDYKIYPVLEMFLKMWNNVHFRIKAALKKYRRNWQGKTFNWMPSFVALIFYCSYVYLKTYMFKHPYRSSQVLSLQDNLVVLNRREELKFLPRHLLIPTNIPIHSHWNSDVTYYSTPLHFRVYIFGPPSPFSYQSTLCELVKEGTQSLKQVWWLPGSLRHTGHVTTTYIGSWEFTQRRPERGIVDFIFHVRVPHG